MTRAGSHIDQPRLIGRLLAAREHVAAHVVRQLSLESVA